MNRLVHRTETPMEESPVEQFWAYDEGINAVLQFDGDGEVTHRYLWSGAVDQLLRRRASDEQVDWRQCALAAGRSFRHSA